MAYRHLAGIGPWRLHTLKGTCGGEQIEIEADPRHIQVAAASLGIQPGTSNGLIAPYTRPPAGSREESAALSASQATLFRSPTMRWACLAGDRPDVAYAVKELARRAQIPLELDLAALRRVLRYLLVHDRQVLIMARQPMPRELSAYSDSDHVGCRDSRRSTSAHSSL